MDFSKVRVQVAVPESEVPFIKNGLSTKVMVEELPNSTFEGAVTRFTQALDEATKTMLVEIELPNPKAELRPGMYATTRITIERKPDVLLIPAEALVVEKTRTSVFTIAEGKAKRLTIKTGFNDGGWVEVSEGLKLNDTVVLAGKQTLADGQPLTVRLRAAETVRVGRELRSKHSGVMHAGNTQSHDQRGGAAGERNLSAGRAAQADQ